MTQPRFRVIGLCWLLALAGATGHAATPMRAVILFDTSGSMQQNDPHHLSHVAAQLFLELARPQDQIGLVAFSDTGVPLLPMTALDSPAARIPFLARLRALRFTGQTTDLAAALETALGSFVAPSTPTTRNLVLLLTDGKLDLGRDRRHLEGAALGRIREHLLPEYHRRHIALYTIAFTEQADQALLQDMARATGGEFRFIPTAALLHKAFMDLFMRASEAESLPLEDGAFFLDSSIQEAALVLSKQRPNDAVSLMTPGHQRLHPHSQHPGVTWNSTPAYELVQLAKPEPGPWQVDQPSGTPQGVAIIGASSLKLDVTLTPGYREAGAPFHVQALFLDADTPLRQDERLQGLRLEAGLKRASASPEAVVLEPQPDGTFRGTVEAPPEPGRYDLTIRAHGPHLQRQRVVTVAIHPPCFQPGIRQGPPTVVSLTLAADCPVIYDLALDVGLGPTPDEARWQPMVTTGRRHFQTELSPTETAPTAWVRIRGHLEGEAPFELYKGPLSLPVPPPETTLRWSALILTVAQQLLLLNLGLVVLGGGGYAIYRFGRRQRRTSDG